MEIQDEAVGETSDGGKLFELEIHFDVNQSDFSVKRYRNDFIAALKTAMEFENSVVVIEGHSDNDSVLKLELAGKPKAMITKTKEVLDALSIDRAERVKKSFLDFVQEEKKRFDPNRLAPEGLGIKSPKVPQPKTPQDRAANRRVVFTIVKIEGETADLQVSK